MKLEVACSSDNENICNGGLESPLELVSSTDKACDCEASIEVESICDDELSFIIKTTEGEINMEVDLIEMFCVGDMDCADSDIDEVDDEKMKSDVNSMAETEMACGVDAGVVLISDIEMVGDSGMTSEVSENVFDIVIEKTVVEAILEVESMAEIEMACDVGASVV